MERFPYVWGKMLNTCRYGQSFVLTWLPVYLKGFEFKTKALCEQPFIIAYNEVALIPSLTGEASIVIKSLSDGIGMVRTFVDLDAS